jgi:hypothetical protein
VGRTANLSGMLVVMLIGCCTQASAGEDVGDDWHDRIEFSGLFYLNYEHGEEDGEDVSRFFIGRAYLTAEAQILPYLTGRVTLDTSQDLEGQGRGDMEVRLKYAFARFDFGDRGPISGLNLEAGIVHMAWLDFEEHINRYRMRGPMFMERAGIFSSADFGLTLAGGFGHDLEGESRRHINSKYAARNGSFAVGLYNGGGYHGDERNSEKTTELRASWRPMPDRVPGLQISGLAIVGTVNLPAFDGPPPPWETSNAFVSFEHERGVVAAQYVVGQGNQRGDWIEPDDPSESADFDGYSAFGEVRLGKGLQWRLIVNLDRFERWAGNTDESYNRGSIGVGYDLGGGNILMLDADRIDYDRGGRSSDTRYQVAFQLRF